MLFILITIMLSFVGFVVNNGYILVDELNLISADFLFVIFVANPIFSLFIIWSYCNIMNIKRQKRLNKHKSMQKVDNDDYIGAGLDCSNCVGLPIDFEDCEDCIDIVECSDIIDCGDCIDGVDCMDCGSGLDCGDCLSGADCGGVDCG